MPGRARPPGNDGSPSALEVTPQSEDRLEPLSTLRELDSHRTLVAHSEAQATADGLVCLAKSERPCARRDLAQLIQCERAQPVENLPAVFDSAQHQLSI